MVMGKVSKAIAASFLCLSLFNASGDFASAMKSSVSISKKNPVPGKDAFKTVEGEDEISNQDKDKGKDKDNKDKDKMIKRASQKRQCV